MQIMRARGPGRWRRALFALALALAVVLAALLALWRFVPPVSTLMLGRYVTMKRVERVYTPLERIAPALVEAVVVAEDARFCRHGGVDWSAVNAVIETADEDGPSRGASTIAMQTAKNLFLWPSRSYIRKALEIPLALAIDLAWPKRRVLEVYLNIAEWGEGVFGVEAAARRFFGKSAAALTAREAALLAAALPLPLARDPARPTSRQQAYAGTIAARARLSGGLLDCLE
jgi:monofunctional biosynthetic peptidoglycan transglycosylase